MSRGIPAITSAAWDESERHGIFADVVAVTISDSVDQFCTFEIDFVDCVVLRKDAARGEAFAVFFLKLL